MRFAAIAVLLIPLAAASLKIVKPVVRQIEDGAIASPGFRFLPGDNVFIEFQVEGFGRDEKDDNRSISLEYTLDPSDAAGIPIANPVTGKVAEVLLQEDKDWLPKVRAAFVVPPYAPSGEYRVALRVKDLLSGEEAKLDLPFGVEGKDVPPSETIVARNVRFLRQEADGEPLTVAAYREGDTVWARFDITGFSKAEANRFEVEYGLAIENAAGKVLFNQESAARQTESPFYPQRYVPGVVSLQIQPKTPKGNYRLVLTLRDKIAQAEAESRHSFTVE